jgi:hypothetical protein
MFGKFVLQKTFGGHHFNLVGRSVGDSHQRGLQPVSLPRRTASSWSARTRRTPNLRRHLRDGAPVSTVADRVQDGHGKDMAAPTTYHSWLE